MFDLVDFSKRKSINHSKSHGRGRKAENEIWLKNKYDINSCSNFSLFLLYFKPTQLHGLQIIGNLHYLNKTLSLNISPKVLQNLLKINSKQTNLSKKWIGIQKKIGERKVAYFRKLSDLSDNFIKGKWASMKHACPFLHYWQQCM